MGRGFYFQVTTDFDSYLDNPLALFSARGLFLFYLIEMVTILTHYS